MQEAFAQFKVRKLKGVTEIRLCDDPTFRRELAGQMPQYAPLLTEPAGKAPSFDELKMAPEALSFLGSPITEKEVLFVDKGNNVCAASSWSAESGYSFRASN